MFWYFSGLITTFAALTITFSIQRKTWQRHVLYGLGIFGLLILTMRFFFDRETIAHLNENIDEVTKKVENDDNTIVDLNNRIVYSEVAKLNAQGLTGSVLPPLTEESPIHQILGTFLHSNNNTLSWDCSKVAMEAFDKVIRYNDKFPFSYFFKGTCEKQDSDSAWHSNFETARKILAITTQIPGHNVNHDEVLSVINRALKD